MKKVNEFIDFISRSTLLQDVAFGTKKLKLNSGETMSIPAFVRTMTASKILYLYQEECKQEGKLLLIERTSESLRCVLLQSKNHFKDWTIRQQRG